MNDATRRELPSQVLGDPPIAHGPLAAAMLGNGHGKLTLAMFPAQPTRDEAGTEHVEPPACGWTFEADNGTTEDGPLSTMSFIAAWSTGLDRLAGSPVTITLHSPAWLGEVPFVAMHPSGFLQAVSYDAASGSFARAILYPTEG